MMDHPGKREAGKQGKGAMPYRIALVILMALLAVACVETKPAGPVLPLVPGDAVLAVVVDSPWKLYQAAEEFWKAAGIAKVSGGDLASLMGTTVPEAAEAEKLLDFARPWALALVPSSPGSKELRTLIYIPFRGKSEALLQKLGGESMKVAAQASGYAVLASGEGEVVFPPKQALDLSRLARYPAASVKIWTNPNALRLATMDGFKPIKGAVRRFVSGETAGPEAAFDAIEEAALSLLRELRSGDAAILPGASGILLKAAVSAKAGSTIEKTFVKVANAPSALDWTSQISSRALYGYSWSVDPAITAELSTAVLNPLFSSLGIDPEIGSRLAALQARWADVSGPRGAASLDMDFDPAALDRLSLEDPSTAITAMKKAFKLEIASMQEAKDEAKYRSLLLAMPKDPDMEAFLRVYGEKFGIGIEVRNVDGKDGSFAWGEMSMAFKLVDGEKFKPATGDGSGSPSTGSQTAQSVLDALGSLIQLRWTVSPAAGSLPSRFFATTSDLKGLKSLATRQTADMPLSADPAFAAFAKGIGGKPLMVGFLSSRRLATLMNKLARSELGKDLPPDLNLDPERFSAWFSYLSAEGKSGASSMEMGYLIPAKDVEAIIEIATKAMSAKKPDSGI